MFSCEGEGFVFIKRILSINKTEKHPEKYSAIYGRNYFVKHSQ